MKIKPNRQECPSEEQKKVNASFESPDNQSRVSTSSETKYEIDAKELKSRASFRKFLVGDGANVFATLQPGLHHCNCPFHKDEEGKLFIWSNDAGAKCVACGWRGDIYDYIMKKHDVGFYDAVQILNEKLNDVLRDGEGAQ